MLADMLYAAATLIVFQYLGELVAEALGLPVPGVVLGMLMLLATIALLARGTHGVNVTDGNLGRLAKALHDHFGLLFVPAGAGIVDKLDRLAAHMPALVATIVLSTVAAISVTSFLASRRSGVVAARGAVPAQ